MIQCEMRTQTHSLAPIQHLLELPAQLCWTLDQDQPMGHL